MALDIERHDAALHGKLQLKGLPPFQLAVERRQLLGSDHQLQDPITGKEVAAAGLPLQIQTALVFDLGDLLRHDAVETVARVPACSQTTTYQCRTHGKGHYFFHIFMSLQELSLHSTGQARH